MNVIETPLAGLLVIEPKIYTDDRGYFYETFQNQRYAEQGIPPFVQENVSRSKQGVLRGLHYQMPRAQGKLVWVSHGNVLDIVLDIRRSSDTFGKWYSIYLSADNHKQMYVPPGFAHGFCVLSEEAVFHYQCTDYYQPGGEFGIAWNDPMLNIPWPVASPILSEKDIEHPYLNEVAHDRLFA